MASVSRLQYAPLGEPSQLYRAGRAQGHTSTRQCCIKAAGRDSRTAQPLRRSTEKGVDGPSRGCRMRSP